jgi:hypothetical protein
MNFRWPGLLRRSGRPSERERDDGIGCAGDPMACTDLPARPASAADRVRDPALARRTAEAVRRDRDDGRYAHRRAGRPRSRRDPDRSGLQRHPGPFPAHVRAGPVAAARRAAARNRARGLGGPLPRRAGRGRHPRPHADRAAGRAGPESADRGHRARPSHRRDRHLLRENLAGRLPGGHLGRAAAAQAPGDVGKHSPQRD